MTKVKFLTATTAGLLVLGLVASCGSSSSEDASSASSPATSSSAADADSSSSEAPALETSSEAPAPTESSETAPSETSEPASIKLPDDIAAAGSMAVGISTLYPPFTYLENNELTGYEFEILEAISDRLGIDFEYERVEFTAMIPGVQSQRFRMAGSGISDFADRQEVVDFVDYTGSYTTILAANSVDPKGWADLCGMTVGVSQGTAGQRAMEEKNQTECVDKNVTPMNMSVFKDAGALLVALEAGRVDAMPLGLATAVYNASKLPDKVHVVDTKDPTLPMGSVFLKTDTELRDAVAEAVAQLDADGTLLEIHKKWGLEAAYLTPTGINLGTA